MKIVFVIDQLDCGGAEQQLVTLCQGLATRAHDVHVITIHEGLELRGKLDAARIPISIAHKYHKFDLTTAWRLRRLITGINPDLVHAYLPGASFLTPLAGVKVPVLLSERGINDWRSRVRVRADNLARRNVVHITCNAEAVKKHLIEVEQVAAEKISVIYNGLQVDRRKRPDNGAIDAARRQVGAPQDAVIVSCVANFSAVKQHSTLLRAMVEAKRQVGNLFLVLIGRGKLEPEIRRQIDDLGLRESCRLITDCANPLPFLCASRVAILTSLLEGCSNALLEAMAMGLPVVASNTGGTPELVTHGRGGYLCPVGEVGSFAKALVRLASEPHTANRMGQYNCQRVDERFTDEVLVTRSLSLYESILDQKFEKRSAQTVTDGRTATTERAAGYPR